MGERRGSEAAREAGSEEINRVAELARQARNEALQYRGGERWLVTEAAAEPLEDHLARLLPDPQAVLVVGTWDEVVMGYGWARMQTRLDGSLVARVEELFVCPDVRSLGVGESVFNALAGWARDNGAAAMDSFVLPGHREAKNFFETFKMTAHALIVHTRFDETTPGLSGKDQG